jgi:outer membrane protein assembly factor BamB
MPHPARHSSYHAPCSGVGIRLATVIAALIGSCGLGTAAETSIKVSSSSPLGTANLIPSPDRPVGWRGDGTGRFPGAKPPTKWSRTSNGTKPESSGIMWMTPVPAGASAPIVVGDRIFFGFDPYGLICISKTDGHILWYHTHHYYEVMPDDQRKMIEEKAKAPYAKITDHFNAELKRMSDAVSPAGVADDRRFMNWQWGQEVNEAQKQLDAAVLEVDKDHYHADKNYWEFASATPISDGKCVYMWFSNRVAVCYDLDGNRKWVTIEPVAEKKFGEHGRHSSPVLMADKFVVEYANDIIAFDRKTGKKAWANSLAKAIPWAPAAYASLVPAVYGGLPYVVSCRGESFRVTDGELGWGPFKDYGGENSSAIVELDHIFLWDRSGLIQLQMPTTPSANAEPVVGKSLRGIKPYMVASPLFVNGIVYVVSDKGELHAFDPASGTDIYTKQLSLNGHIEYVFFPGYAASPTLAGKYIYIMDNQGGTLVMEPGPVYKEIAVNHIETFEKKTKEKDGKETVVFEQTVSNPVFDGKMMYIRGQQYLYGIGSR